jgi:hypothetical protein
MARQGSSMVVTERAIAIPIATAPPPRVSAAVLRARPLAQAVQAGAVGGALLGTVAAMALAAPGARLARRLLFPREPRASESMNRKTYQPQEKGRQKWT